MDRTTKVLLSLILVVNLAAASAVGYVAWKSSTVLASVQQSTRVLDEATATVKEVNTLARDAVRRLQDTQGVLKKFNPLAR